jgi:precorrin-6Y C5,15-methyltransferase (decarboxylating)
MARLAPLPGELLWDLGAGCGSIGIEWMRAERGCRAVAIEPDVSRRALIERNRDRLGVPELALVAGRAPEALEGLDPPDAIFIGGGLTVAGVAEHCWEALKPGGRLVANAVTVQSEAFLVGLRERIGGELTRISVAHAAPLGRFDGWRAAMPVTILVAVKHAAA